MSKPKIGFIGCGGIFNSKHGPGMEQQQNLGNCELVAFCDLIEERAQKAAETYGAPGAKVYTDYKELLADPEIDAVHVLTPNVAHCEISVAALEAGKHVLCEKPMAATIEDAQRMVDTMKKTGKLLTIGYQYRHFPINQTAKAVVDEGWIGDVYYAEACYIRRRGVPTWGVFTDKSKQGGGPLIDIGTHCLDLTLWMMDNYDVDYVVGTSFEKLGKMLHGASEQGQTNRQGEPNCWNADTYEVEDSAFGHIKMKNGAVINLKSSWAINASDDFANGQATVLLCGTKGGLDTVTHKVRLNHIVGGQQSTTIVGREIEDVVRNPQGKNITFSKEHDIWVKAVKGEGELFVTAEQSFTITKILASIYKSSLTGKPVYFDDNGNPVD